MEIEYEVRILEINVDQIKQKLSEIGAKFVSEKNFKRYVYDLIPKTKNSWIRLRTDGTKTTLTYKQIDSDKIDGTSELEFEVQDFEKTHLFLETIGNKTKNFQENKRISYKLNNVEIEIDTWKNIPTYLEIDAKTKKEVEEVVKLLGFEMKNTTSLGVKKLHEKYGVEL